MIGVLAPAAERRAVEEFFELFKTPWEFFQDGRRYDVVIATADISPPLNTRLLIISGPSGRYSDSAHGIEPLSLEHHRRARHQDIDLPLYGDCLTFVDGGTDVLLRAVDGSAVAVRRSWPDVTVIRLGYDLFAESKFLLASGQPPEHAHIPTLDRHIAMLREWILSAGIDLVEIPPVPAGYDFIVCLTHDVDFVGIRRHRFDHTMWGFLYRATIGALAEFLRGRRSLAHLGRAWRAALSLPFVYLRWAPDFWDPFAWYLQVERGLGATYFVIPFKGRVGDHVTGPGSGRRAAAYDIADLGDALHEVTKAGCEVGVHGIDAWHSAAKGRDERARVEASVQTSAVGVRMHWLLSNEHTFATLDEAGYRYDTSVGYNETIGYRAGTSQVFRPIGVRSLLELPLHIQDGALFFRDRLGLSESEAWARCRRLIAHARTFGGALTVLWHDRSHAAERFWGDFYLRLISALRALGAWFGTAGQVVGWFHQRRHVIFEPGVSPGGSVRVRLLYDGPPIIPALRVRFHRASTASRDASGAPISEFVDIPWDGKTTLAADPWTAPPRALDVSLR